MENKIGSATEIEETGSYLQLSFSQAPKKNHDALAQLGKRFMQWLKKYGVKVIKLAPRGDALLL